jgi:hypothetical protein
VKTEKNLKPSMPSAIPDFLRPLPHYPSPLFPLPVLSPSLYLVSLFLRRVNRHRGLVEIGGSGWITLRGSRIGVERVVWDARKKAAHSFAARSVDGDGGAVRYRGKVAIWSEDGKTGDAWVRRGGRPDCGGGEFRVDVERGEGQDKNAHHSSGSGCLTSNINLTASCSMIS